MNTYVLIGLASSFFYAMSISIKGDLFKNITIPAYTLSIISTFIASLIGFILVHILNLRFIIEIRSIVFLSVGGMMYGISLFLYFYSLEKDDVNRVSQLSSLEIVVTPIAALIILQETPQTNSLIGIIFIIIALFILILEKNILNIKYIFKKSVIPIFVSLILWASTDMIIKTILESINYIQVYFWVRFSSFITILILLFIFDSSRENITKIYTELNNNQMKKYLISVLFSSMGLLLAIKTLDVMEVVIAAPIVSSYSIFVLIISYIKSKIYNNTHVTDTPLWKRTVSGLLFIIGIIFVTI